MSKKITYEYVKEFIEDKGYKLLSTEYVKAISKLQLQCPDGHIFDMSYNRFQQGSRCPVCAIQIIKDKQKLPFEEVKKTIESVDGYKLLSDTYVNVKTKLDIMCPEGHKFEMAYSNFQQGQRCPECSKKTIGDKNRFTFDYIKEKIESTGYTLLNKEYIDSKSYLDVICPNGHQYKTSWNNFNQGYRCRICSTKVRSEKRKHSYDKVKSDIESVEGYILLSNEYINDRTKLDIICPEGHEFKMNYNSFKQGKRCPICMEKIRSEKRRHSYDFVKGFIEDEGYKLLSTEYINARTKLDIECPEGHEFKMSYDSFKNKGQRCPKCSFKLRGKRSGLGGKFTINDVREYVESQGYTLLSKEYNSGKDKLKMICPEGHEYITSYNNFKSGGHRCPKCWFKLIGYKNKTPYDKVKSDIESVEGYKLLSTEYVNSQIKLDIMCPEGHEFKQYYHSFKAGHRCPQCAYKLIGKKNVKGSYEEVKEYVESQGYELLSTEYINSNTKLDMRCPEGHEFKMNYTAFHGKRKSRCPECSKKIRGDKTKLTFEEIKEYIESIDGYKLLSTEYKDCYSKLDIVCPKGHEFKLGYSKFKFGQRCPICSFEKAHNEQKLPYEDLKNFVESQGYILLSKEYINAHHKLKLQCPNGHDFKMTYHSFQQGSRCPLCNTSKGEDEVKRVLEDYNISYEPQYRFDDCRHKNKLPFDFYLPELNICIEYDGQQHFRPVSFRGKGREEEDMKNFKDTQLRDSIKDQYCKDNNIKLIRIPYTEFDNIEEILIKELNLKKVV